MRLDNMAIWVVLCAYLIASMGCGGTTTEEATEVAKLREQLKPFAENTVAEYEAIKQKEQARKHGPWTSATKPLTLGDITIQIVTVSVGKVPLVDIFDEEGESKNSLLVVWFDVRNNSEDKKRDYRGYMDEFASFSGLNPYLVDNHGNRYRPIEFGGSLSVKGAQNEVSIYPGKSIKDVVVFEPPVDGIRYLRLGLPARSFGEDGEFLFEIPGDMIKRA